jgi:hypothetical protein
MTPLVSDLRFPEFTAADVAKFVADGKVTVNV